MVCFHAQAPVPSTTFHPHPARRKITLRDPWKLTVIKQMLLQLTDYVHKLRNFCEQSTIFLPARRYASAGYRDRNVSVCPSVCLSVRPSVTRRYCVKTKKASVMISSLPGRPKILVFWRQISFPNSKGFRPNGGLKEGWGKNDFLALSVNISKTVADTAKFTISD